MLRPQAVLEKVNPSQKSGNRKYPHLSFAQYLETGASKGYQIWQKYL